MINSGSEGNIFGDSTPIKSYPLCCAGWELDTRLLCMLAISVFAGISNLGCGSEFSSPAVLGEC